MLQHALPEEIRDEITNKLFKKYVNIEIEEFSSKIYMSRADISNLIDNGMFVGSHGSNHYWLDRLNFEDQEIDIQKSLNFLDDLGVSTKNWIMCYPYGAYNSNTLKILKNKSCAIGVTTEAAVANLNKFDKLRLPRFDTNDFPQ